MKRVRDYIRPLIPYGLLCEYDAAKENKRACVKFKDIESEQSDLYRKLNGRDINWDNPDTFSEKIMVNKIYGSTEEKSDDTDKCRVRKKVKEKIGEQYLIPVVGIFDNLSQVKLSDLPNQFVIKCTHDSHSVKIVEDKRKISKNDWKRIVEQFDHFYLKRKPHRLGYELHYADIKPQVIVEKYMGDNLNDYKFLCFDGKPFCCWVDTNRFKGHMRDFYDLDWNHLDFHSINLPQNPKLCERPKKLEEMITIAKVLSSGYDHVRVDLYEIDGEVYFGELTFTSDGGYESIVPEKWDKRIGELWNFDFLRRKEIRAKCEDVREICRHW